MLLACGVLLQALAIACIMQQKVPNLKIEDIVDANFCMKELKNLNPIIWYSKLSRKLRSMKALSFSDAAFNIGIFQQ